MKVKNLKVRLVKLPANVELMLFLIKQELKSCKVFNGLSNVGLNDCFYQCHFGSLILECAGFEDIPDDLSEFYTNLIDRYSKKIEADNDTIMKCAFDFYIELMIEKKRRSGKTVTAT